MSKACVGGTVVKVSSRSVGDTVARLLTVLSDAGVRVFAVVDHSGEAQRAGLTLRETRLVIFGNPAAGTPVMNAAPLAGLDLPLKVLVWQDSDTTKLAYDDPMTLVARRGVTADLVRALGVVDGLTDAAIAP